jgi:glutathione S-transferase
MSDLKLVIGDKNRSPWSLRAWLLLRHLELEFDEISVPLGRADTLEQMRRYSPSGSLPVLLAGDIRVWDALAIAEFLADHFPSLWPDGAEARALARSICAELHAGFRELDAFLPMDFTARFSSPGRLLAPVAAEVRRVFEIWTHCRIGFGEGGPFLFGAFTIADAMFAPVCAQIATHGLHLDQHCRAYVQAVTGLPAVQEWAEGARAEVGASAFRAAPLVPRAAPTLAREEALEPEAPPPRPTRSLPEPAPRTPEAVQRRPELASRAPEPPPALPHGPYPDEEEDTGPPAPGLPGVVPTRPYEEDEGETEGVGRLLRPAAPRSLFRWRQPIRLPGSPPPAAEHPERPAAVPREPPPEARRRPAATEPPARPAEPVGEIPPAAAQPRPGGRNEAVKPIGDGIHRRR